jgi:aspartate kinase
LQNIPIRVKNAFDPENPGTLISCDYISPEPRVEMICGRDDVIAIEVYDAEMVGESGYDYKLLQSFYKTGISYIAKNTNANTITHFIPEKVKKLQECIEDMQENLPNSEITTCEVAIISVIGTNMKIPGFLSRAANALASKGINILALDQCMRQVNMQFIIEREFFEEAQLALHQEFVEKNR